MPATYWQSPELLQQACVSVLQFIYFTEQALRVALVSSVSSPEQGVCRWKIRNSPGLYSPEGISERPKGLRVYRMIGGLFAGPRGGKKREILH